MLPLIAALFLTGLMVDVPEPAVVSTIQKFILAIGFLPILLFVSVFAFLLAKQRWLQLGVWIGFAGIITLLLATLTLWADSGSEPWLSGEHYAMTGWYLIFVMGAYLTGFAMVAALPTMVRSVTELVQPKATQISRQRA